MNSLIKTVDAWLNTKSFGRLRVAQFGLAVIVFTTAALMPSDYVPSDVPDYDLHFIGNVLLFLSASVAFLGRMKLGILIVLLTAYSLIIELSQWLTPSRQVDPHDMLANMLGLLCGYVLVHTVEWIWNVFRQNSSDTRPS